MGSQSILQTGLAGAMALALNGASAGADDIPRGRSVMPVEIGGTAPLPVHMFVPESAGSNASIVLVMHGASRNADDYRDNWIEVAEACEVIIAAPEFSRDRFPRSARYNLGGLADAGDEPAAFDVVGLVFEAVQDTYAPDTSDYVMFGHSAGSQFVHRYAMFRPDPRMRRAVAANAGWYTVPDPAIAWPYGFADAPETPPSFEAVAELPIELHLGTQDNDPNGRSLRRTPEAAAQGAGRFDRGLHMAEITGWPVTRVEGADHDNALMVPSAARTLLAEPVATSQACARATQSR
jgi:pimeloyl-ACP methyl ester carboxylesterase